DVQRHGLTVERVHVFGKRFPVPFDALGQHRSGNIFNAFHHSYKPLPAILFNGRKANATVPHDGGRDAVPGRGAEIRITGSLPIVVRVYVDPTWGNQATIGIDLSPPGPCSSTRLDDSALVDRHIPAERRLPRNIYYGTPTNHKI